MVYLSFSRGAAYCCCLRPICLLLPARNHPDTSAGIRKIAGYPQLPVISVRGWAWQTHEAAPPMMYGGTLLQVLGCCCN